MSIAGPEDERPGDEVEGIHYFDFTKRPGSRDPEADPFALEGLPEPREAPASSDEGRTDTEQDRTEREPEDEPVPTDPFEYALTGTPLSRSASRREQETWEPNVLEPEPEPVDEPSPHVRFFELASLFAPPEMDTDSRARFAAAFDAARAERGQPFLAIALRMAPHASVSEHFPIVADGIRSTLHPGDLLLSDDDRLRLVAVLRGRHAADARPLFAHLKDHLRMWVDDADDVLRAISALAAPNGYPFEDAEAFLTHAFDRS